MISIVGSLFPEAMISILLVEDNPAEATLTKEALRESGLKHELVVVSDGEMATEYLRKEKRFPDAKVPSLVLLDLNLPRKNGREVLSEIKSDPNLCMIPVIVVSNSSRQEDIEEVYRLRGNSYLSKPSSLDDWFIAIRSLVEFWCLRAQLPGREKASDC